MWWFGNANLSALKNQVYLQTNQKILSLKTELKNAQLARNLFLGASLLAHLTEGISYLTIKNLEKENLQYKKSMEELDKTLKQRIELALELNDIQRKSLFCYFTSAILPMFNKLEKISEELKENKVLHDENSKQTLNSIHTWFSKQFQEGYKCLSGKTFYPYEFRLTSYEVYSGGDYSSKKIHEYANYIDIYIKAFISAPKDDENRLLQSVSMYLGFSEIIYKLRSC